nr:GDP-mannose 4,6-dehydratase [Caldicellulosiruptor bescii]
MTLSIDIAKLILKLLGKPENLIQFVADRPGHDRRYAIDSSKIQKELGWKVEYKFDEAIRKTIEWYKNEFFKGE